jgi:FkbM family methyltransferase
MNLQTLASHTIDVDLLPDEPTVLDVGCRWFDFTKGILALRPKARFICLDPSSDVALPEDLKLKVNFFPWALNDGSTYQTNFAEGIAGDGGGNHVIAGDRDGDYRIRRVPCTNVKGLMQAHMLDLFDAVKLDCEGSEFGILENWPGPIATQISVEFHDWTGPWKQHGCERAMTRLHTLGYKCVQHYLSQQGTGIGHWDSLFVLNS